MAEPGPDPLAPPPPAPQSADSDKTMATIVYVLYLVGLVNGITALVGVILALIRKDGASEPYANHFTYQIFTFLYGLAFAVLGLLTVWILGLGLLIWLIGWVWFIVRSIVGLVRLLDNRPNPDPRTFWV